MRTSIWLLPAEPEASTLTRAIIELADDFDAPRFVPHMTLVAEVAASGPVLTGGLEALARRAPFSVPAESLEVTEVYHRALFLRLRTSPALLRMREEALETLATHGGAPWIPHVSLLYTSAAADEKRSRLPELASWVPRQVRFDRIAAVETTGAVETWKVYWEGSLAELM